MFVRAMLFKYGEGERSDYGNIEYTELPIFDTSKIIEISPLTREEKINMSLPFDVVTLRAVLPYRNKISELGVIEILDGFYKGTYDVEIGTVNELNTLAYLTKRVEE